MTTLGAVFLPQLPPERLREVAVAADDGGAGRAVAVGGLLPGERHRHRRRRPGVDRAAAGRGRAAAGAAAQRRADRDGGRDARPAVPGPGARRRRPRRPGLDGAGRRAGRVAADAAARVPDRAAGAAGRRAGDHRRAGTCGWTGRAGLAAAAAAAPSWPARSGRGPCGWPARSPTARSSPRHDPAGVGRPARWSTRGARRGTQEPHPVVVYLHAGDRRRCRGPTGCGRAGGWGYAADADVRVAGDAHAVAGPSGGGPRPAPTRWCCSRPRTTRTRRASSGSSPNRSAR